ncbi:Lpg1974 family pore-forming outer membrane protein [Rhodoplanes sp. Z2-YC6860]|uniref:Lpg1974 family pore-forming outer membrane protein n=1 Tax=Rhodoplanes sp. Z2-YC6860 TaxID=674703 RepID=UPI0012EDAB07|nr:Lpg1974 family pore-forming outer membrane protein [Rhodoplanes sp. Z2-YC6860]
MKMKVRTTGRRGLGRTALLSAALLSAAFSARAMDVKPEAQSGSQSASQAPSHAPSQERSQDRWHLSVQTPYGFTSGGSQGSYYFQTTPGTAFSAYNGTRGFTDLSIAQPLGFVRELGIGKVEATFGARVAEPLITNGFTPSIDARRYSGIGPRLGLQGNAPVNPAWTVEWQVGASMLYGSSASNVSNASNPLAPYASQSGSVANVDGFLGLSHWFDAASKLTVGYRADALFNDTTSLGLGGTPAPQNPDRVDHGPVVRFTIQK